MGFIDAIRTCLRKTFVINGRASRSEYWYFVLFYVLYFLVAGVIFYFFVQSAGPGSGLFWIVAVLLGLPAVWFYVAGLFASVRRLHDGNWSGWWIGASIAVGLVSGVMDERLPEGGLTLTLSILSLGLSLMVLVLTILKGTEGPNRYGEDPFGLVDEAVFE